MFQTSENLWTPISESQAVMLVSQLTFPRYFPSSLQSLTSNPSEPLINLLLPEIFSKNIVNGTNNMLKIAKRNGILEPEVQNLDQQELKKLFGMLSLMQQYNFPSYKSHFDLNSKFFKSPVVNMIGHERFKTLLSHFSLRENQEKFDFFIEFINFCRLKGPIPGEYLFLRRKKFEESRLCLFLLYEENGYLLNGAILEENGLLDDKNLKLLLNDFQGKYHILIMTEDLFDLNTILFLKTSFKIEVLGFSENDFFNILQPIDEKYKNEFYSNGKILVSRTFTNTDILYLFMNTISFYNENVKKNLDDQALDKINGIYDRIKGKFNFSIRKEFENEFATIKGDLKLILFMFQTIINNTFLLKSKDFSDFNNFLQEAIKDLLPKVEKNLVIAKKKGIMGHFPDKLTSWCKKCRVCLKNGEKTKKTKYRCLKCSLKFNKDIPLCVSPCFKIFHENILQYTIKYKTKNANCEMDNTSNV